jgi:hypothetical protein
MLLVLIAQGKTAARAMEEIIEGSDEVAVVPPRGAKRRKPAKASSSRKKR